jgi:hypothetical protein
MIRMSYPVRVLLHGGGRNGRFIEARLPITGQAQISR